MCNVVVVLANLALKIPESRAYTREVKAPLESRGKG
jgi:hypothetical protein